ncbi:hypothetical protein BKA93DRAFT_750638 [Sparassis latifolia]
MARCQWGSRSLDCESSRVTFHGIPPTAVTCPSGLDLASRFATETSRSVPQADLKSVCPSKEQSWDVVSEPIFNTYAINTLNSGQCFIISKQGQIVILTEVICSVLTSTGSSAGCGGGTAAWLRTYFGNIASVRHAPPILFIQPPRPSRMKVPPGFTFNGVRSEMVAVNAPQNTASMPSHSTRSGARSLLMQRSSCAIESASGSDAAPPSDLPSSETSDITRAGMYHRLYGSKLSHEQNVRQREGGLYVGDAVFPKANVVTCAFERHINSGAPHSTQNPGASDVSALAPLNGGGGFEVSCTDHPPMPVDRHTLWQSPRSVDGALHHARIMANGTINLKIVSSYRIRRGGSDSSGAKTKPCSAIRTLLDPFNQQRNGKKNGLGAHRSSVPSPRFFVAAHTERVYKINNDTNSRRQESPRWGRVREGKVPNKSTWIGLVMLRVRRYSKRTDGCNIYSWNFLHFTVFEHG